MKTCNSQSSVISHQQWQNIFRLLRSMIAKVNFIKSTKLSSIFRLEFDDGLSRTCFHHRPHLIQQCPLSIPFLFDKNYIPLCYTWTSVDIQTSTYTLKWSHTNSFIYIHQLYSRFLHFNSMPIFFVHKPNTVLFMILEYCTGCISYLELWPIFIPRYSFSRFG